MLLKTLTSQFVVSGHVRVIYCISRDRSLEYIELIRYNAQLLCLSAVYAHKTQHKDAVKYPHSTLLTSPHFLWGSLVSAEVQCFV